MYFERQIDKNCVIHSVNNSLQGTILSIENIECYMKELYNDKKIEIEKKNKTLDEKEFYKEYKDKYGLSLTIVMRYLKEKRGYYFHVKTIDYLKSNLHDRYVIGGENKIKGYRHAVAIYNGYWFDSENPKPIFITEEQWDKINQYFKINLIFKISTEPLLVSDFII